MFTMESKHVIAILVGLVLILGFMVVMDRNSTQKHRVELIQKDECSEDEIDFPTVPKKKLDDLLSIDQAFAGILDKVQTKTDTSIPLFEVEGLWVQGHVFPRNVPNITDEEDVSKQMGMFVHILPDNAYLPEDLMCSRHEGDKTVRKLSLITFNFYEMSSDIDDGSHLAILCSGDSREYLVVSDCQPGWDCSESAEILDVDRSRNAMGKCYNKPYDDSDGQPRVPDKESEAIIKAMRKADAGVKHGSAEPSVPFQPSYSDCPAWGLVSPKNPDDLAAFRAKAAEGSAKPEVSAADAN